MTAVQAGDYGVGFSFLFYSDAAVFAVYEKGVAFFADLVFVLCWEAYSCGHGYFLGVFYVALG